MTITSALFDAYLKCPTRCFLLAQGEPGTGNAYAEWVQARDDAYRSDGIMRLKEHVTGDAWILRSPNHGDLASDTWRFAVDFVVRARDLESHLQAVERLPADGQRQVTEVIPMRFVTTKKLTRHDKLRLAFDAIVLSGMLGAEVKRGAIIYGEDRSRVTVKTAPLVTEVRTLTGKMAALLSAPSPPDLILNRHCGECEFQARCRQKAMEQDDLSLLAAMTEKERKRLRSKGIFTVTQLSYTFRPRRTPKRAKHPATPHYLALQALAIRENTVYVHGIPQLTSASAQVYLDIEGLPDSDFYYLIGVLLVRDGQEVFHSFWADSKADEPRIFAEVADTVCQLPEFRVFHFGEYETVALKRIRKRLPAALQTQLDGIRDRATNVLSIVHPHLYFPTYSNGLKDIGRFLGYERTHEHATGLQSIMWRTQWEVGNDPSLKANLICYNQDDCRILKRLCDVIARIAAPEALSAEPQESLPATVHTRELRKGRSRWEIFGPREYTSDDFKHVNKCAYFDYQREKVFVRTHPHLKIVNKPHGELRRNSARRNTAQRLEIQRCPRCRCLRIEQVKEFRHDVVDLKFPKGGVKRWITRFVSWRYRCPKCQHQFSSGGGRGRPQKYGHGLMSWCVYSNVVSGLNMSRVQKSFGDVFGLFFPKDQFLRFKRNITALYQSLYTQILQGILASPVVHIDETTVRLQGQKGYVWVLTSLDKVYYFYRPSREGSFLQEMLQSFSGVLVSDFFTAYDSLSCEQQKCLVHLMRDIDDDLLQNPMDVELKAIAQEFGTLLRAIIATVDGYGLKRRHLHKHRRAADRFLDSVGSHEYLSDLANKYKKRFQKSGSKLFTFLDHDGVPWNNTNAEHAIKRFAKYRRDADGRFTERSLEEYLVLASVFETCEFNNVNVLNFLLSKETSLEGLFRMARRRTKVHPLQTQAV